MLSPDQATWRYVEAEIKYAPSEEAEGPYASCDSQASSASRQKRSEDQWNQLVGKELTQSSPRSSRIWGMRWHTPIIGTSTSAPSTKYGDQLLRFLKSIPRWGFLSSSSWSPTPMLTDRAREPSLQASISQANCLQYYFSIWLHFRDIGDCKTQCRIVNCELSVNCSFRSLIKMLNNSNCVFFVMKKNCIKIKLLWKYLQIA